MRCNICGKEIEENKTLCEECEAKKEEYKNIKITKEVEQDKFLHTAVGENPVTKQEIKTTRASTVIKVFFGVIGFVIVAYIGLYMMIKSGMESCSDSLGYISIKK